MAQPYLVAMEHAEWHAKNVLKKFHKNRPLGRIEGQHRYHPPQPVLSCKTVDIDSTGTRTYRSLSNKDIIEEQHKLIHEIYSQARNIYSAPSGGRTGNVKAVSPREPQSRSLSALKVHGKRPSTGSSSAVSSRPVSSVARSRPSSSKTPKTSFIVLKVRPHTTGSRKQKATSATDSYLSLDDFDTDWEETSLAYQSSREQIKRSWVDENRTLDEGKFVRGKKDQPSVSSSLNPKAGHAWMTFGGGQKERSAGIVDAFTAVKEEDKYFSIDGSTGVTVAKQVHKGDKIRIGKNGQPSSLDSEYQQWTKDNQEQTPEDTEEVTQPKPMIFPLSWEDQVAQSDEKVIEATSEHKTPKKQNLCERHPVVFKKFGVDGSRPPAALKKKKKQNGVKVVEGYTVTRRTAERMGVDGKSQRPTDKVTHISVTKTEEVDGDEPPMSYEDVLEMRIRNKSAKGPHVYEEVSSAAQNFGHQQQPERERAQLKGKRENSNVVVTHVTISGAEVEHLGMKSPSKSSVFSEDSGRKSILKTRPKTSSSSVEHNTSGMMAASSGSLSKHASPRVHSAASGLPADGLPITNNSANRKGKPPSASGQSRPPPAKPVLHKASAAIGGSVPGHRKRSAHSSVNGADSAEYLHFSQQLCVSKEHRLHAGNNGKDVNGVGANEKVVNGSTSNAAILSVSEHNKPVKDVKFKEEVTEFSIDVVGENVSEDKPLQQEDVEESTPHHYAFNIPTAELENDAIASPHRLDTPPDVVTETQKHSQNDSES